MPSSTTSYEYQRIEKAIDFIQQNLSQQPSNAHIAAAIGMSTSNFEHQFQAWAGTSPQRFMRYLSSQYAKRLLLQNQNITQTSLDLGLSSSSRLHDLLISYEALTPGQFKAAGKGLVVSYGQGPTPFGMAVVFATPRGLLQLAFIDPSQYQHTVNTLKTYLYGAIFEENTSKIRDILNEIFEKKQSKTPVHLLLRGTNFQIKVWEALLKIPFGSIASYETIAQNIDKPTAMRAVGTAIGANQLAYLIPCHRVINKIGISGQYRWGNLRKRAILGWEAALADTE
jgi:AraC family transcriptional regulator, regulatory protein of adaptative response / methylated-DNA-[protein]-cysteine methyltransferase